MIKLITKLQSLPTLPLFTFASSQFPTKREGKYTVPQLPSYTVNRQALRPFTEQDELLSIGKYNQLVGGYNKYREIPQCRYFAIEYHNRIHHVFNAYHYPMGRMINKVATYIRGKNSPHYKNSLCNIRNGDICIIVNAADPLFTGKQVLKKQLRYHTGFIGHLRTLSYRQILNKKPQLLYYYLLRKVMPKTKLSEKYLKNLKIYRGPTHDIANLPQFSPIKFIQNPLTQVDLANYKQEINQHGEVIFQNPRYPQFTDYGGKKKVDESQNKQKTLQTDGEGFSPQNRTKMSNIYTNRQLRAFMTLQKKIRKRYYIARAPYKKKSNTDPGFKMFYSEEQAKKMPYYNDLKDDENRKEDDDEIVEDPLKRKGFDK